MNNKKIKNATTVTCSGIIFKSKLEKTIYNIFKEAGYDIEYEPKRIVLVSFENNKVQFYDKETNIQYKNRIKEEGKSPKLLSLKSAKMLPITYTPDFYIYYNNIHIWLEGKGLENDCYYIKKKLFRDYLNKRYVENNEISIFFEIYSKAQAYQAIKIIEKYAEKCNTGISKGSQ